MKLVLALSSTVVLFCCAFPSFSHDIDWQKTLEKGNHELAVGNTENAVAIFSSKVKKYPTSAACHTALGRAYKRLGKISEAKSEFHDATQLDPAYADGFYEFGVVQESDQNWADAASSFETYLRLKPDASERQALSDRIIYCKNHSTK
jgi:tetratricopeptide (TPR) repeat protein